MTNDLEVFAQMKRFDTSKPVIIKAHRYLTDGKVRVTSLNAASASVAVTGTENYSVYRTTGAWICDCPSRQPICAHVVAASLICDQEFEVPTVHEKVTPFRKGMFSGKVA